jgi:hypothetical protein
MVSGIVNFVAMKWMKKSAILAILISLPVISLAHGYWLDITGTGKVDDPVRIQICFGEIDDFSVRHREAGAELAYTGGFKLFVIDDKGERINLPISPKEDCWEATFIPHKKGTYQILAINEELPVVDRAASGGQNVRPIEYLCAAYQVESNEWVQKPRQFLDILVASKDKLTLVKAFKNNAPAAVNTKLRVFNPENWEKMLTANEQGEAVFMTTQKGLYIIRQDWNDAKPGTWQGKSYVSVRYRCNYSLWIP